MCCISVSSKRIILLHNILYPFIVAALMVLLPLYLIDQQVSLISIGMILSVLPLTFLVVRVIFGSMADEIGTRKISLIESLSSFISPLIYLVAASPVMFALGKIVEGTRDSAFWAVIRTNIVHAYGVKKAERSLAFFSVARFFSDAAGRVIIGLSIVAIGFHNSLLGISLVGLLLTFVFLKQKENNTNRLSLKKTLKRITQRRSKKLWKTATGLLSLSIVSSVFYAFLIPIYTYDQLSMGYAMIGGIMAILAVVTGLFIMLPLYFRIRTRALVMSTILFMGSSLLFFPFASETWLFWLLIILFSIGHGSASILYEEILGNATKKSKDISTDIGVIHIPLRIGEFISFFTVGFVITRWGYFPIFAVSAIFVLLFGLFALAYFSDGRHQIG